MAKDRVIGISLRCDDDLKQFIATLVNRSEYLERLIRESAEYKKWKDGKK